MATFTLGDAARIALGGPRTRATPVRRDSMEAGTFEDGFFTVPAKGEPDRMLRAARGALDAGRRLRRQERAGERTLDATERAVAALTAGAVRVFEEICALARLNRGRVYPSYDHLARATALGRATVARAIVLLEAAGFLVRQRRFRRVAGEGAGPRVAQTSNAYRPALPARLIRVLPRWLRPAPVPCDVRDVAVQGGTDNGDVTGGVDIAQSSSPVGDTLRAALAALQVAVGRQERESHNRPETHPHSICYPKR